MSLSGNSMSGARRLTSTISAGRRGQYSQSAATESYRMHSSPAESSPARSRSVESPAPIWLAALSAATRRARGNGDAETVRWNCVSGRAFYTNAGASVETIHPLGVRLEGGQTLAVWWMPGDTGYTMQVYGGQEAFA